MEELDMTLSNLIQWEAKIALNSASVEEELKATEEVVGSEELAQQQHNHQLEQQKEASRLARRAR